MVLENKTLFSLFMLSEDHSCFTLTCLTVYFKTFSLSSFNMDCKGWF